MTTKLRAMMILETTDQVAAVIEFARTMDIQLDMGAVQEAPKEQMIVMGDVEPLKKHQSAWDKAQIIITGVEGMTMPRQELVRALAKKLRKDPKGTGMIVKSMITAGSLKVV